MAQVLSPTSVKEFKSAVEAHPNAFIALNFHAPWAEPCKQMNQTFNSIAAIQPSSSIFISIDAEKLHEVSEDFEVVSVPFFVLTKGGKVVHTISGADPKELQRSIEQFSSLTGAVTGAAIPPVQETAKPLIPDAAANGDTGESEESLDHRLSKLTHAAPVMLFMKGTPAAPQCGFSRKVVGLLREKGVRYGFFNILADDDVRQGLKEYSNWPTFPQLYVGGELVGGLDIVQEEFENDPKFLEEYRV